MSKRGAVGNIQTLSEEAVCDRHYRTFLYDEVSLPQSTIRDFKQWQGRVIEIRKDEFIAKVETIFDDSTSMIVSFKKDKSVFINEELMAEGATFYWTVGLFPMKSNPSTLVRKSEIYFRLRPHLDMKRIQEEANEMAEQILEKITWLE